MKHFVLAEHIPCCVLDWLDAMWAWILELPLIQWWQGMPGPACE